MKVRSVQALRAIAALLVVGSHLPRLEAKIFPAGLLCHIGAAAAFSVDLFFTISGFVLLTTTWTAFGEPDAARRFLRRRFLRIYPAYWVALLTFAGIAAVMPFALNPGPLTPQVFATSFYLIPYTSGPYLFVAWSLEFEIYFYLMFALALKLGRDRLGLLLGVWTAITLACNALAGATGSAYFSFFGSPLTFEFMGGCIVGYLVCKRRVVAPRTCAAAGLVLVTLMAIYSTRFSGYGTAELEWFRVLTAGPATLLLLYGVASLEVSTALRAPALLVGLGDASYAVYLWHGMLLGGYTVVAARLHPHGTGADLAYVAGAYVVVLCGALFVYRMIELPLHACTKTAFRPRRAAARTAPVAVAGRPAFASE